jgi:hypothetical protein
MTSSSTMKAKILIPAKGGIFDRPLHLGHVKGSTSYIFWINLAQFLNKSKIQYSKIVVISYFKGKSILQDLPF